MRKILMVLCCMMLQLISSVKIIAQDCQFNNVEYGNNINYCNSDPWALIFSDEFNDSTLNLNNWSIVTGVTRDFDYVDQKAWHKPENVVVSNGTLKLISKNETLLNMPVVVNWNPYTVRYDNFDYSTAEIATNQNFSYGKYEARIKVPTGFGLWPAFWIFGAIPTWNEIDIFEFYGNDEMSMTSHYNGNMCARSASLNQDITNTFHVYTLIYEKYKIEWYVDGQLKRSMLRYYDSTTGQEIGCTLYGYHSYISNKSFPINPMAIRLNTAIRSGAYAPNNAPPFISPTIFPTQMEIDWVRYYEHKSCNNILINSPAQITYANYYTSLVGNTITVDPTTPIQIQSNVEYRMLAANKIHLKPGVSITSGANYIASIAPLLCSNVYRMASDDIEDSYIAPNPIEVGNINKLVNSSNTSNEKISIYPNPTTQAFNIVIEFSTLNETSITILNSNGSQIYSMSLGELKHFNEYFDLKLNEGIYLIKINHGTKEYIEKIIITK